MDVAFIRREESLPEQQPPHSQGTMVHGLSMKMTDVQPSQSID